MLLLRTLPPYSPLILMVMVLGFLWIARLVLWWSNAGATGYFARWMCLRPTWNCYSLPSPKILFLVLPSSVIMNRCRQDRCYCSLLRQYPLERSFGKLPNSCRECVITTYCFYHFFDLVPSSCPFGSFTCCVINSSR